MGNYRLTQRARRDILAIWSYIADDNPAAADEFVDGLIKHFQLLGSMPYMGRARDDIKFGYRSFPIGRYLIFYRATDTGVHIMHLVHASRDITNYPF